MITRRQFVMGGVAVVAPCVVPMPTTDDATSTLQRAMDEAVSAGRPLVLDPITYRVGRLNVPNGLVMIGAGNPGGYGVPIGAHTKIALIANTNDHMIYGAPGVAHVRISGVHLDGNKNNNKSGDIIHIEDSTPQEAQWHIRDCFIEAAASNGIYVGAGRRAVQISDNTVNYCGAYGIRVLGSDAHVDRCIVGSNLGSGVAVGGTVCSINECDIYGNGTVGNTLTGDGISVLSTLTKVAIKGNRIDRNRRHGVLLSAGCEDIIVALNMFHGNSTHEAGRFDDVKVVTIKPVIVKDNTYSATA